MNDERDSALAIASLNGELTLIRSENETMESRIDTSLAQNKGAMDRLLADMASHREDATKRETRLILVMVVLMGLAVAIFNFIILLQIPA